MIIEWAHGVIEQLRSKPELVEKLSANLAQYSSHYFEKDEKLIDDRYQNFASDLLKLGII
jgi:hypothetical protein